MDISKIDANLALPGKVEREDLVWMDASAAPFVTYGAVQTSPYLRMPVEAAETVSEGVRALCTNTAGIRVRFCTDSPYIAIRAEWDGQTKFPHMPVTGVCGFDLYRVAKSDDRQFFVKSFVPPVSCANGYESVLGVTGEMDDYVLNLPLYNNVSRLLIGVREGSRFQTPKGYRNELPAVFYGSSITQGGCASRPGNCYQNFLSRTLNMDYVNLGFSGRGRAEDTMIEYLAGLEMSVFVSDYDHNAPDAAYLNATHEKLYRGIRAKHPDVPYVMISRPDYWDSASDRERRTVVMQTYQKALAEGDRNVYFLDGATIFAGDEFDACTVDCVHPNDLGFYRFYKALLPIFERLIQNKML